MGNRISFDFTEGKFEVFSGFNIEYGGSGLAKGNGLDENITKTGYLCHGQGGVASRIGTVLLSFYTGLCCSQDVLVFTLHRATGPG
jgi:hypothetical protein